MKLLLEEMTRDEAREAFDAGATVVVPTGSIEQHGPHLPLVVDTTVVTHVARAGAERAAAEIPVVVTPTMHFGVSPHHLGFAGTLSLRNDVYAEALRDVVRSLHQNGVRKIVLLNGHGGNAHPNGTVAATLVHEEGLDMAIASLSYWSLQVEGKDGRRGSFSPGHAGNVETSLMLALRPDLVYLDRRRAPLAALNAMEHAVETGAFIRAGGTSDDAAQADAAEGKRLLGAVIDALSEYLIRFHRGTRNLKT